MEPKAVAYFLVRILVVLLVEVLTFKLPKSSAEIIVIILCQIIIRISFVCHSDIPRFKAAMFCMYPTSNFEEKNVREVFNCPEFYSDGNDYLSNWYFSYLRKKYFLWVWLYYMLRSSSIVKKLKLNKERCYIKIFIYI